MNLYQINEAILACIDLETGEIIDEAGLEALEIARTEKIENILLYIKNLNAEAEAIKAEKNALDERLKAKEKRAADLKAYVGNALNGSKFETARVSVSFRKSEVLEISDLAVIPTKFLRFKDPEINKADLKKAVKEGLELEGVTIIEKQNIQIK